MKKYILFGKHLGTYHGGAEISLLSKFANNLMNVK